MLLLLVAYRLLLRGTIVNRTYGIDKNLYIHPFLLTIFGVIYYGPPYQYYYHLFPNVQHDVQHWSLITFLKEENKRRPMDVPPADRNTALQLTGVGGYAKRKNPTKNDSSKSSTATACAYWPDWFFSSGDLFVLKVINLGAHAIT